MAVSLPKRLLITLSCAIFGCVLALLPVSIGSQIDIAFPGAAYLIAALWFGPLYGLAAVLPTAALIASEASYAWLGLVPLVEAVAVAQLHRKGLRPLFAAAVFWIGVVALLLLAPTFNIDPKHLVAASLLPIIGLISVIAAEPAMRGMRLLLGVRPMYPNAPISVTLRYWLLFVTALPLLAIMLIYGAYQLRDAEERSRSSLIHQAERLGIALDDYVRSHRDILIWQAARLSDNVERNTVSENRLLRQLRSAFPGYLSLITTDVDGQILAVSFSDDPNVDQTVLGQNSSVSDRVYFRQPQRTGLAYVSNVFRGRGLGSDIISAISAPITGADGQFAGIIEASLDLGRFEQVTVRAGTDRSHEQIIVDGANQVLFASANSSFRPLQPYLAQDAGSNDPILRYSFPLNVAPWTIITRQRYGDAVAEAGMRFNRLLWALPLAGLLATFIARQLARMFSRPLEHIVRQLEGRISLVHRRQFNPLDTPPRGYAEVNRAVSGINALLSSLGNSYDRLEATATERDQLNQSLTETLQQTDSLVRQRTSDLADALRAAKSASDAKNIFLAKTSHEIRTPMHAIIGITELLRTSELTESQDRYAHLIGNAAESLLALIDEILDFSRIEAGQLEIRPEAVRLPELLDNIVELMGERARSKELALKTQYKQLPEWVLLDPVRLRQVLINLINNAIKFTDHGSITVSVDMIESNSAPRLRFAVIDTGRGIPEQQRRRVFEAFAQLDDTDSTQLHGTGLGLAICKRAIELSGGRIDVESTLGEGSTFWFELPLEEPAEPPVEDRDERNDELSPAAQPLLVVDDNPINRQMLSHQLAYLGFDTIEAEDGPEALALFAQQHPPLIWLDCQMPEMDGFEVSRRLRRDQPDVHIIAITAQSGPETRQRCLEAGMDDYVTKPAKLDDIRAALHRWQQGERGLGAAGAEPGHAEDQAVAVLDEEILASWKEVESASDEPVIAEMLDSLQHQMVAETSLMREQLEAGEYHDLSALAHRLKGSAATIGAARIAQVLRRLEQASVSSEKEVCAELIDRLTAERSSLAAATRDLWSPAEPSGSETHS